MPYVTAIPPNRIMMQTDGTLTVSGSLELHEILNNSTLLSEYRIDANGQTSLSTGDDFTLIGSDMGRIGATYLGAGTLSFAPSHGHVGLVDYRIQVAPISGSLIRSEGGYAIVTEHPIDDDHLVATASTTIGFGKNAGLISADAPISGLADALAEAVDARPGPIAGGVAFWLRRHDAALTGSAHGATTSLSHDPSIDRELVEEETVCFVAGTLIDTDRGLVAIEDLAVGDLVWTKDDGFQPLRWIGKTRLSAARLAQSPNLRPVRIRASALAPNVPSRDLLVSPQHRILVRSKIAVTMFGAMEVLVPAKQLLQIDGIDCDEQCQEVEYFHMLFDHHQIVASNGAETESLYTGPQALRSLSHAAREEIFALFPVLKNQDHIPEAIRPLPAGRLCRKLAQRHAAKHRDLIC